MNAYWSVVGNEYILRGEAEKPRPVQFERASCFEGAGLARWVWMIDVLLSQSELGYWRMGRVLGQIHLFNTLEKTINIDKNGL